MWVIKYTYDNMTTYWHNLAKYYNWTVTGHLVHDYTVNRWERWSRWGDVPATCPRGCCVCQTGDGTPVSCGSSSSSVPETQSPRLLWYSCVGYVPRTKKTYLPQPSVWVLNYLYPLVQIRINVNFLHLAVLRVTIKLIIQIFTIIISDVMNF